MNSGFPSGARPRVIRVLMGADIVDGRIFLETMLGSVTMMNIPVQNEYFIKAIMRLEIPCQNCNVIKQAKTQCHVFFSMMSGRSDECKPIAKLITAAQNFI